MVALAAAGSMALSGCGSDSGGGGKSSGGGGLGGGGGKSSSNGGGAGPNAGKTFSIGFQGALTGDNKQLGINEVNAVELAVAQANAKGDLGFTLKVAQADDGGVDTKAPAAAQKLIQDTSVLGVVGPAFSGPTAATGKAYAAASMGLISPSATNEDLTKSGFTTFHRIVPTDGVEGKATAEYLAKKYKSVFVIDDATTYGKGVADVVRANLKGKVKLTNASLPQQNTQNYPTIAQQVVASKAQAMYYGGYDAQAAQLTRALTTAGYKGFRISGNGGKSSVFTDAAGAAGNNYYFACGCLDATAPTAPEAAKTFNTDYQKKFNAPSSTYSPEAFDATNALIEAMKSIAGTTALTREAVNEAIGKLDFQGITTTVKFQSNGEVAQATVNLYVQKNGKIQLVGDIADAK
ncbi:branched-chain amino acid ABC transporter substrate-binding protein [Jatrophihabitans fulvus]